MLPLPPCICSGHLSMFPGPLACGMWSIWYDALMMHNRNTTNMALWACKCSHPPSFAGVRVLYSTHTCFSWSPVQTLTSSGKHAQNILWLGKRVPKKKNQTPNTKNKLPCGFFTRLLCPFRQKKKTPSETAHTSQWDRKRSGMRKFVKSVTRLSWTRLDRHVVGKASLYRHNNLPCIPRCSMHMCTISRSNIWSHVFLTSYRLSWSSWRWCWSLYIMVSIPFYSLVPLAKWQSSPPPKSALRLCLVLFLCTREMNLAEHVVTCAIFNSADFGHHPKTPRRSCSPRNGLFLQWVIAWCNNQTKLWEPQLWPSLYASTVNLLSPPPSPSYYCH